MQSIISSIKQIGLLTIALTIALAGNLAYGQWVNPSAVPPGDNPALPINTSVISQIKVGNLGINEIIAASKVRSDQYCDFDGNNCFTNADIANLIAGNGGEGLDLVNGLHSSGQCTSLGGIVTDNGSGNLFCRFSESSCPAGWAQFNNWSTTNNGWRGGWQSCGYEQCNTGSHGWSNRARETCQYPIVTGESDGGTCYYTSATVYAGISEIGCY